MAEIAREPEALGGYLGSLMVAFRTLLSLLVAIIVLAPIAVWNRYVFLESNLLFLFALFISAAAVVTVRGIPRGIFFPGVAAAFALFVLYAWMRLDDPWSIDLIGLLTASQPSGLSHVVDLGIYYALFTCSALLYYRRPYLSPFLWFLICGYCFAFIVRNSLDVRGLQEGYNLSPGFVLVPLLPLLFLRTGGEEVKRKLFPFLMFMLCMAWLVLIGARTAVGSMLLFLACLYAWPLITRNKFLYYLSFWGMWVALGVLTVLYLTFVAYTGAALVEDSDLGIFRKGLGTRVDIWAHLAYLISQRPLLGYGADQATEGVTPLAFMQFAFQRDDLSSHSLYFELLYRIGLVGAACLVLVLFAIWRVFWRGRHLWEVRVAAAFLICITFFSATGEFLVFSEMRLRSGFAWIVFGIGAGACLRALNRSPRATCENLHTP